MITPLNAIEQLADMVTGEWGETEAANTVYEWLWAQRKGGSMNEQLDDIRARRAAITPGVWEVEGIDIGESIDRLVVVSGENAIAMVGDADIAEVQADATFIAAAPADIDALLRMVDALTAERDALAAQLAQAQRELAAARSSAAIANLRD